MDRHTLFYERRADYNQTEQEFIEAELERLTLLNQDFGYSAFNPSRLQMVVAEGTQRADAADSHIIYCATLLNDEGQGKIRDYSHGNLAEQIAMTSDNGPQGFFSIYDLSTFLTDERPAFTFDPNKSKLDSLVSIVQIDYETK